MKVLITGATGFLGFHLTRRMLLDGHRVRVLCRPTPSQTRLAGLDVEKFVGDITDPSCLSAAVAGCHCVIHAAANVGQSAAGEAGQFVVNVEGTRNIARAARESGVTRFLHVSSAAAIGISADPFQPASEEFTFNLDHTGWTYHLSKHRAEQQVLAEAALGLDVVIVNPAVICGPADGVYHIAEPIKRVLRSSILPFAPGGLCLVHVGDVVRGIVLAVEKGKTGKRYILGGSNVSLKEMNDEVCDQFALKRLQVPVPAVVAELKARATKFSRRMLGARPLPVYARRFCFQFYDSRKARDQLGWDARAFRSILTEFASSQGGQTSRSSNHNMRTHR